MNGRIYDPTLGRFLQADPYIQAPKNSQSYNRYSYVLNNPLSFTDPSGYFFDKLFKGLNKVLGDFAPFISIALLFTPIGSWAATGLWQAATVGFVTGGIATGSLKGALIGAFSGAAFQHIGATFTEGGSGFLAEGGLGHVGAHAVTGGVSSVLSGGKFGHGFFSAGLTKGLNVNGIVGTQQGGIWNAVRTATAAIIGGTISKVTGGKFANGAVTAGFAQAVNGNKGAKRADSAEKYEKKRLWLTKKYDDENEFIEALGVDGKTVIVFGKRGLNYSPVKVSGPLSDLLNHEVIHEQAFVITADDSLYNRGFGPSGLFSEDITWQGFGGSSYSFSGTYYILPSDFNYQSFLNSVPGSWSPNDYTLMGTGVNNCQSYCSAVRSGIENQ
jgi:hypothetical protein